LKTFRQQRNCVPSQLNVASIPTTRLAEGNLDTAHKGELSAGEPLHQGAFLHGWDCGHVSGSEWIEHHLQGWTLESGHTSTHDLHLTVKDVPDAQLDDTLFVLGDSQAIDAFSNKKVSLSLGYSCHARRRLHFLRAGERKSGKLNACQTAPFCDARTKQAHRQSSIIDYRCRVLGENLRSKALRHQQSLVCLAQSPADTAVHLYPFQAMLAKYLKLGVFPERLTRINRNGMCFCLARRTRSSRVCTGWSWPV